MKRWHQQVSDSVPELSSFQIDSSEVRPLFLDYPSCPLLQNPHVRHCIIYKRMQKLHCAYDFTDSKNLNSFTEHIANVYNIWQTELGKLL